MVVGHRGSLWCILSDVYLRAWWGWLYHSSVDHVAFGGLYWKCIQTLPSYAKAEVAAAHEKLIYFLKSWLKPFQAKKCLIIFICYWNAPSEVLVGYTWEVVFLSEEACLSKWQCAWLVARTLWSFMCVLTQCAGSGCRVSNQTHVAFLITPWKCSLSSSAWLCPFE